MKIEVIPGIIEDSWGGVLGRLNGLEGKTPWVHLDVSDGILTDHKTWENPGDLLSLGDGPKIELHLMIDKPWETINQWLKPLRVGRVVVHVEAFKSAKKELEDTISIVHGRQKEVVIALNPETPWESLVPHIRHIDGVLIMGVIPGWSGAEFKHQIIEKLSSLRQEYPDVTIGVDGGVNADRAPELVSSGANRLVATSFIESFKDPSEGIIALQEAAYGSI